MSNNNFKNNGENYKGPDEKSDEQYEIERRQRNTKVWKETIDMLKIIVPTLIIFTVLIRVYFDHLIEQTRKERELEAQQIEAELIEEEKLLERQEDAILPIEKNNSK